MILEIKTNVLIRIVMSKSKLLVSLGFLLFFVGEGFAQKSNLINDLSRIKLFVSNKQDVEKIYGKGKEYETRTIYETDQGGIRIVYSEEDCKSVPSGLWDVPKETVVEVSYSPGDKSLKLKELIFNKKPYKLRETEGDVRGLFDYYNDEKGISITFVKKTNELQEIIFYPTKSDFTLYSCDKTYLSDLRN